MEALLKSERDNLRIGYGDEDDDDEEEGEEEDPENPTDPCSTGDAQVPRAGVRAQADEGGGQEGAEGEGRGAAGVGVDVREMVRRGRTADSERAENADRVDRLRRSAFSA